jgi:hypothetical protein
MRYVGAGLVPAPHQGTHEGCPYLTSIARRVEIRSARDDDSTVFSPGERAGTSRRCRDRSLSTTPALGAPPLLI